MALTDEFLVAEHEHLGGVQRIYRFPSGYGLSMVNSPMLHIHPFAWEAAVIGGVDQNGRFGRITDDTPLTSDVEVFDSDDEANAFIAKAASILSDYAEDK